MKKISAIFLATLWAVLAVCAWFGPAKEVSQGERRKLAQFPALSWEAVLEGDWMEDFEDYSLDQFPLRDSFRKLKALFHYGVLNQKDNNGIYLAQGYAAELEYPLNAPSVNYALGKFNDIYEHYLTESEKILVAVVPDKGYFLARENGYPVMDYGELFEAVQQGMPWAAYVDLIQTLELEDYYRTDTHWRQERLLEVSQVLCQALEVTAFAPEELTQLELSRPFYGVYYGQAALPMDPETMYTLTGAVLEGCTVYNHETGKTTGIYDWDKLTSRDLYDVYLSGAAALLTIDNPAAPADRELIVFRDSFGSSLVPLLVKDYRTVTVVDIRYLSSSVLEQFLDFHGQDVLFLYSALVLNQADTLK